MSKPLCVHCSKRVGNRGRGLCDPCYGNTSIRCQHPPRHKQRARELDHATAEELDALIESQRASMPVERYEKPEARRVSPLEMRMVRWRSL